jgi:hypothetical protein
MPDGIRGFAFESSGFSELRAALRRVLGPKSGGQAVANERPFKSAVVPVVR